MRIELRQIQILRQEQQTPKNPYEDPDPWHWSVNPDF